MSEGDVLDAVEGSQYLAWLEAAVSAESGYRELRDRAEQLRPKR